MKILLFGIFMLTFFLRVIDGNYVDAAAWFVLAIYQVEV